MRHKSFVVIAVLLGVLWAVSVFAQAPARDVTVQGDSVRGPLVAGLISAYFGIKAVPVESRLGEYVLVSGPGGEEKIHFSPKLVSRLQKLSGNPRAGEGLMNVCPTQARQIHKAVGGGPLVTFRDDCGKKRAVLEGCRPGLCWVRNPTGTYWIIGKLGGVSVDGNINNPRYSQTNVSAKMQVEGGRWIRKIVIRNQEMAADAVLGSPGLQREIFAHLDRVAPLVSGKSGREGDTCFERTWKVCEDGKYFILKDES